MGNEAKCTVRFGKQVSEGKALLETAEIIFRGEFRLKLALAAATSVKAVDGELRVQTADGLAVFELGATVAEKWERKILHPKSRMEKLGVRTGSRVSLLGRFEDEFVTDLKRLKPRLENGKSPDDVDWIFLSARSKRELSDLTKIARRMKGGTALWIVYPKGEKEITENDVLGAGRRAGLKDVKVVGFSATNTALKFVLPLSKR